MATAPSFQDTRVSQVGAFGDSFAECALDNGCSVSARGDPSQVECFMIGARALSDWYEVGKVRLRLLVKLHDVLSVTIQRPHHLLSFCPLG